MLHVVRYLARSRNPTGLEWLDKLTREQQQVSKSPHRSGKGSSGSHVKMMPSEKAEGPSASASSLTADGGGISSSADEDLQHSTHESVMEPDDDTPHPDTSVFINFRELLWYWSEYYLRRGRDRLSLEFSTHVPFRQWKSLVGKSWLIRLVDRTVITCILCDYDCTNFYCCCNTH